MPCSLPSRRPAAPVALLLAAGGLLAACGGAAEGPTVPAGGADPTSGAVAGPADDQQAPRGGLAVVDPHHPAHPGWRDLGTIPLGQTATCVIELENREGRPLTVQSVRAGCACTIPSLSYLDASGERVYGDVRSPDSVLTLPAGAVAELTLRVDSRRAPVMNAPKRVTVRLVTDSTHEPYLTVEAQFVVQTPFQLGPERLDLGEVAQHGSAEAAVRLIPLSDLSPVAVHDVPAGFEVWLEESYYLGRSSWDLHARALPPRELGFFEHVLTLSTRRADGAEGEPFEVPLRVTGVPDVQVEPTRLVLRPPDPGATHLAEVTVRANLAGHRFALTGARLEGPGAEALEVELLPTRLDQARQSPSWTVRLHEIGQLPDGALAGTLTLSTDDPNLPELVIPYLRLERS